MNEIELKVFKPDYGFIFKNYLDPNIWGEEYVIYAYRGFSAKIRLYTINTKEKSLTFIINYNFNDKPHMYISPSTVDYKLDHPEYTLKIFENKVMGRVSETIKRVYGQFNYEEEYNWRCESHDAYKSQCWEQVNEKIETFKEMSNIPEDLIDWEDVSDSMLSKIIGDSPSIMDYRPEHYELELNVFKGIKVEYDKLSPKLVINFSNDHLDLLEEVVDKFYDGTSIDELEEDNKYSKLDLTFLENLENIDVIELEDLV